MGPKGNSKSSRRDEGNQADDESEVASLPVSLSRAPTDESLGQLFKKRPQSDPSKPFDPDWTIDEWKKEIIALAQIAFPEVTSKCREQSTGFAKDEDHYKVLLLWERQPSGAAYYYASLWTSNCGNLQHVYQIASRNDEGFRHVLKHLFLEVTKKLREVTKSMTAKHSEIY